MGSVAQLGRILMRQIISFVIVAIIAITTLSPAYAGDYHRQNSDATTQALVTLGIVALGIAVISSANMPRKQNNYYYSAPRPQNHWQSNNHYYQPRPTNNWRMPGGCHYVAPDEYTNLRYRTDPQGRIYVCG